LETLLIIEDDPALLRGLKDNFEQVGYTVLTAVEGEAGLNLALDAHPDLILLDIMLPKINGYEICRLVRQQGLDMPVVMLTAKGEEADIVLGLNLGADDYVTKPFGIRELKARVEAFLRRRHVTLPDRFAFGEFILDVSSRQLFKQGTEVALSPKEYKLLVLFLQKQGKALTRDEILNHVWGYNSFAGHRSVDRFIATLRNKIEANPSDPTFIQTLREVGYRFECGESSHE
jgi:DNA-binding response OmpR family regulator